MVHITTLGDIMLDVIVDVPGGLRPDDDAEAHITLGTGGQAVNVATWAVALGATATIIGPRGGSGAAELISARLAEAGVDHVALDGGNIGTVVSIVDSGMRTMASDPGAQGWLARVRASDLPERTDWLHLSAYPLLRTADPTPVVTLAASARAHGARVSLDLSSASLLAAYGVDRFAGLVDRLAVMLVFANRTEWDAVSGCWESRDFDVVVKDGADGATVLRGGSATPHSSKAVDVVDATGAGDALAAGYLVGGIGLGLEAAARCVRTRGAQPRP